MYETLSHPTMIRGFHRGYYLGVYCIRMSTLPSFVFRLIIDGLLFLGMALGTVSFVPYLTAEKEIYHASYKH